MFSLSRRFPRRWRT